MPRGQEAARGAKKRGLFVADRGTRHGVSAAAALKALQLDELAGLGGLVFILPTTTTYTASVSGYGFLAMSVVVFGQWKPWRIALAALLFGLFRALSNVYVGFDFLKVLNIPGPVYNMMPYIISLIVLAFTSKRSRAPKAEGIPYDKGQR